MEAILSQIRGSQESEKSTVEERMNQCHWQAFTNRSIETTPEAPIAHTITIVQNRP